MTPNMLSNIRLGFATNSSSSHSIIMVKDGHNLRDETSMNYDWEYGWGDFTLASGEEKQKYVFCQLAQAYKDQGLTEHEAVLLANGLLGTQYLLPWDDTDDYRFNIDHQSLWSVPRPHGQQTTMQDYVDFLKRTIINDDCVLILGGNDNSDGHPLCGTGRHLSDPDGIRFVSDPQGHLTFFMLGGQKLRTKNLLTNADPEYSTVPELMDIKITDRCNRGCPWCMENSTPDGKDADWRVLSALAHDLGQDGVLEVAIGGGEPTLNESFVPFLYMLNRNGVTANFSTGTMDWLDDASTVKAVRECCGAVAFSTQSTKEALQWITRAKEHRINHAVHFIVGLDDGDSLTDMLLALSSGSWLSTRLVLLGLKAQGRYAAREVSHGEWWKPFTLNEQFRKLLNGSIAIDSSLVPDVAANMPDVDPRTYEISDGRFSMYYDAVKGQVGVSSHLPERTEVSPYNVTTNGWDAVRKMLGGTK